MCMCVCTPSMADDSRYPADIRALVSEGNVPQSITGDGSNSGRLTPDMRLCARPAHVCQHKHESNRSNILLT